MQGIYWWLNRENGKVYVGSAKSVVKRKAEHLRMLRAGVHDNPHLQSAWNKYGSTAFEFEIIEKVEDEVWLRARETAWINKLQSVEKAFGYNICRDGWTAAHYEPTEKRRAAWKLNGEKKVGTKDPPEVKARKKAASILRAQTNKFKQDILVRRTGKVHSEEGKKNLRDAWARKKSRGYVAPTTFTTSGKSPWNKDKTFSEEFKKKMSVAQKASWTPERRAAQSERLRLQRLNNPDMLHKAGLAGAASRWNKV